MFQVHTVKIINFESMSSISSRDIAKSLKFYSALSSSLYVRVDILVVSIPHIAHIRRTHVFFLKIKEKNKNLAVGNLHHLICSE